MKKSFAAILLILIVCAALSGCGDASGRGVIGATPAPAPASPMPSAAVSMPPLPNTSAAPDGEILPGGEVGTGMNGAGTGNTGTNGAGTSSAGTMRAK